MKYNQKQIFIQFHYFKIKKFAMVIASSGYVQNVLNSNQGKTMSAIGILICHDNSYPFQERTLPLGQPVKIGRSVARARAATDNAIFDCKVLSRNHALLWFDSGKFYLKDTKSSNGTFVNNKRLSPSGEESIACEVCSGDVVQFGVDVVESTKKVTHGCIIATLKLYLPDGKEAKATVSHSVAFVNVTLEDLYKLNQYIQEAGRRENALRSKLEYMQQLLEHTKIAANQSWKASILEDCLLSRLEMLESQVNTYSKNFADDKLRIELATLLEDKVQYQNATKELLQKKVQEKREIIGKVQILRCLLNETEEETQSLHNVIKNNQNELQELAIKYIKTQQVLEETTEKLSETKTKLKDFIEQSEKDKEICIKQYKDQKVVEKNLQLQIKNSKIEIVNSSNQIHALRSYMQTLQDMTYATRKSCNTQDHVNPINAINMLLDKSSSSCINVLNKDIRKDKKPDDYFNSSNGDIQLNIIPYVAQNYLKNNFLANKSSAGISHYKYILPPASNRAILTCNSLSIINTSEFTTDDYFIKECSVDLHSNNSSNLKNENENNSISDITGDVVNKKETDTSPKLSIKFSDNKSSDTDEVAVSQIVKSQLVDCSSSENFPNDLFSAHFMKINQQIGNELEKCDNKPPTQTNQSTPSKTNEINADNVMNSFIPITNHFVLSKFFQYLVLKNIAQSSNFLEANKKSEKYTTIVRELQDMKNWLLHESDEIVLHKLKIYYHQLEAEFQNVQELSEQLVILKEKYNNTMEKYAYTSDDSMNLDVQSKHLVNITYMVPIYYVAPIVLALIWMLVERVL